MRYVMAALVFAMVGSASAGEWYQGGTLQSASLRSWAAASYSNRLATAADAAAVFWRGKLRSMEALRPKAEAMENCISRAAGGSGGASVRGTAASCAVMMGWQ